MYYKTTVLGLLVTAATLVLPPAMATNFESASDAYRNQNYAQAFEEFSELANSGDPRAQTVLAIMYKYGESVALDLHKSYDWYLRAAIQGYPPAQYNVGLMLADGIGVERDTNSAVGWLQKAADSGYERAKDKIAEVTGDSTLATVEDEPIAWSKSWNLRLPNEIRDEQAPDDIGSLEVYRVQLGAMSTLDRAQSLWQSLLEANSEVIGSQEPIIRETTSGQRTIYRLQLGSFKDAQSANLYCDSLRSITSACIVVLTE